MPFAGRYRANRTQLYGDMLIVVFLSAQVLDGVFTYVGVRAFGTTIEANPVLAWLIDVLGPAAGLTSAKAATIGFGLFLHLSAVHRLVGALAGLYLVFAVAPWTYLLFWLG